MIQFRTSDGSDQTIMREKAYQPVEEVCLLFANITP